MGLIHVCTCLCSFNEQDLPYRIKYSPQICLQGTLLSAGADDAKQTAKSRIGAHQYRSINSNDLACVTV
jgi:hypothetical protein